MSFFFIFSSYSTTFYLFFSIIKFSYFFVTISIFHRIRYMIHTWGNGEKSIAFPPVSFTSLFLFFFSSLLFRSFTFFLSLRSTFLNAYKSTLIGTFQMATFVSVYWHDNRFFPPPPLFFPLPHLLSFLKFFFLFFLFKEEIHVVYHDEHGTWLLRTRYVTFPSSRIVFRRDWIYKNNDI